VQIQRQNVIGLSTAKRENFLFLLLSLFACIAACKAELKTTSVVKKNPAEISVEQPSLPMNEKPVLQQVIMGKAVSDLVISRSDTESFSAAPLIESLIFDYVTSVSYFLTNDGISCGNDHPYAEAPLIVADVVPFNDGKFHICIKLSGPGGDLFESSPIFLLDRTPPSAPNAPISIGAFSSSTSITFSWAHDVAAVLDAASFEVRITTSADGTGEVGVFQSTAYSFEFPHGVHGNVYFASLRAQDAAGNFSEWSPMSDGITIDTTGPIVGEAVRFQEMFDTVLYNTGLADIGWSIAPSDPESGITKQSILIYANNSDCTGSPSLTIDVESTANSFIWRRLDGGMQGELRFRVRAENSAGIATASPCSGAVFYRNAALTWTHLGDSFGAGQGFNADSLVDIDGDGIKDIVLVNRMWSNGRGGLMIIRGNPYIHRQPLLFYEGEQDLAYPNIKIGDVTGDGIADVVLYAPNFNDGDTSLAGVLYILKGGADLPASAPLASVAMRRWTGSSASAQICSTRLYLYDATGDGINDIFCSNAFSNNNTGAAAFIIGGPGMAPSGLLEANADRLYTGSVSGDRFGPVTANCYDFADVYGDSRKDLIISNTYFNSNKGAIFVITTGLPLPPSGLAEVVLTNFQGEVAGDKVGAYAICADITGDGKDEIISLETTTTVSAMLNAGSVYVVESALIPPAEGLVSTAAKRYDGDLANDRFGTTLKIVDVDGDGISDILSANSNANPGGRAAAGSIFFVKGGATLPPSGSISSLANAGRRYDGNSAGDNINLPFSATAKMTNSAIPELIAVSSTASPGGRTGAGSIYIIPGQTPLASSGTMASLSPTIIEGELAGDALGSFLLAKNLNGDSFDDLILFSPNAAPHGLVNAGSIFVIPGATLLPASGLVTASGYRYDGEYPGDLVGNIFGVANVFLQEFDINGDGFQDLITGSSSAAPGGLTNAGSYYILKGGQFTPSGPISTAGIRLDGDNAYDDVGCNFCLTIRDLNGDGFSDLIFRSSGTTVGGNAFAGSVWVVPGRSNIVSSKSSIIGKRIDGSMADDRLGSNLVFSDLNTDGYTDILIGGGYNSGRSQILGIYGSAELSAATLTTKVFASQSLGDPHYIGLNMIVADVTGDGKPEIINGGFYMSTYIADLLGSTDNGGIFIIPNAQIPK